MTVIKRATFPNDTQELLSIWREFVANSPVNLDYQNNDAEFANLPGKYAAPGAAYCWPMEGTTSRDASPFVRSAPTYVR